MSGVLPAHLVLFDGVCGFCQRSVRLLIRLDRRKRLHFAALAGETGRDILKMNPIFQNAESMLFVRTDERGTQLFQRSTAFIQILCALGGLWRLAKLLLLIPRFLRDAIYNGIAAHRYEWFGRTETCPVPAPEVRERFLP